ncbi:MULTISPECIES: FMN-dependent NADH-azoreductase [Pseudoalteromonas]|uniref:FMN-dependent NADH-azoreductase n=1 Tax=Pseudoalteromonas TaxID=53246 RepID=UPI000C7DD63F|nr:MULTISPECIES: NAD(P)H-dependent oxidoreductase [Pseudoalteromonas]AUJ69758.1 FMN-dependent NADH-azoreductase 1 [Pseudoalteromonas sp. NC201]MCF7513260.1 NAD(P)H-dependent oxidoreductase [Pseudoalteromonas sp. L7]MCF7525300.1 NAD(P)H-dependent oxidoreductase [Pseudoalteromonas sp. L23]MCX2765727.1 NAD(P)H-dependent oxidoreductase [Pseudoalteromonas sp. B530]NSY32956.1 FMN-dependent NADH-azoreductase [Pseudoalteromonas sp. JC28]
MKNILYISSSVRKYSETSSQHQSISRMLGEQFLTKFSCFTHEVEITHRDLSVKQPAFIDEAFIAAAFAKGVLSEEQRLVLAESDEIIKEVTNADIIVIASPMYNYGMPAVLKAWFDLAIRVNKTFSFDLARGDKPLEPILSGKTLVLLASWGEFAFKKGESQYHLNHLSSHIEQLAPYLGAEAFYEIASEYQEFGDDRHKHSKQRAIDDVHKLAQILSAK